MPGLTLDAWRATVPSRLAECGVHVPQHLDVARRLLEDA
jgi:hypothetical protein